MASDDITVLIAQLNTRLEQQEKQLQRQEAHIQELTAENQRLKQLLQEQGASKGSKPPHFSENYSVDEHTGKSKSKRGRQATGRRPGASKLSLITAYEDVYEEGVPAGNCIERRRQSVWRIINGQATYICYRLFARPASRTIPSIPGVRNCLSEYGIEMIVTLAFLHYWVGISIDHACGVMQFFTGLELSKSQANSLLEQLSRNWQEQYDTIAALLAQQLVIYVDETGWQVGRDSCYTWAFATAMHVLFRCGVGRGKAEAQAVMGEQFEGIGVTDDYGAY